MFRYAIMNEKNTRWLDTGSNDWEWAEAVLADWKRENPKANYRIVKAQLPWDGKSKPVLIEDCPNFGLGISCECDTCPESQRGLEEEFENG